VVDTRELLLIGALGEPCLGSVTLDVKVHTFGRKSDLCQPGETRRPDSGGQVTVALDVDLDVFPRCESWEMIESSHTLYRESVL
jgi:hypothetical protein